jgi:acetate kinase
VLDPAAGRTAVSGVGERLGTAAAELHTTRGDTTATHRPDDPALEAVTAGVLDDLAADRDVDVVAVGHRVVHGGERFTSSVLIDDDALDGVRAVSHLAPLHNPANLAGIDVARAAFPDVPHVAVFDTAFHASMPPVAYRYAVPQAWYREHGVRRYGFHGTSHRFVARRAAELLGRPATDLRLVTAHLGNGCSATAVADGVAVDTTMGLTPLEGLVMGTRSGDVDPGLHAYLAGRAGLDVEAVTRALNRESGLLGLSGRSNDMRTVIDAAEAGDGDAALALDVFVHRLAKALAGLAVPLGRLDALVFTGGIGEHSAVVRSRVLARLRLLGLEEDPAANAEHGRRSEGRISLSGTAPVALVVPTDEEREIAQETLRVLDARGGER